MSPSIQPHGSWISVLLLLILVVPVAGQPGLLVTEGLTTINSGDTHDLGDVLVGSTAGVALVLRSNGDEDLVFGQPPVAFGGAPTGSIGVIGGTSAPSSLTDLPPGNFTVLPLSVRVLSAGEVSVNALIASNDPDNPLYLIVLEASGVQPVIALNVDGTDVESGDTVDLGDVTVGESVQVNLQVDNTGDATLNVEKVLLDLGGALGAGLANTVPVAIEAGQTTTIPVTFTANEEGEQVTQLSLLNDTAQNPFVVVLRANGLTVQNGQAGACGFGAVPVLPLVLLGLTMMRFRGGGRSRRR